MVLSPAALLVTVALLWYYSSRSVGWASILVTGYTWFCALSVLALLPADLQATLSPSGAAQEGEEGQGDVSLLAPLWSTVYWSMFVLTWALLPFVQMYADSGFFTAGARCRDSLKQNLSLYAAIGVVGALGVLLLVLSGEFSVGSLMGLAMAAANAFGLVIALTALGYGLVELPRGIWRRAGVESRKKWAFRDLDTAARRAAGAASELRAARGALGAVDVQMSRRDALRMYVDIVLKEDGEAQRSEPRSAWLTPDAGAVDAAVEDGAEDYDTDVAGVAALRRRLARARAAVARNRGAVEAAATAARSADAAAVLASGASYGGGSARARWTATVEPLLRRVLAVVVAAMSVATVLAESTIAAAIHSSGMAKELSMFAEMVDSACETGTGVMVAMATFLPLAYVFCCAFWSLFQLRLFDMYALTPGYSDAPSLVINASLVARFAAPLAYNFLTVLHAPPYGKSACPGVSPDAATAFSQTMHVMDKIPIFGRDFNTYVPLLLLLICGLSLANIGGCCGRAMSYLTRNDEYDDMDESSLEERCRRLLARDAAERGVADESELLPDAENVPLRAVIEDRDAGGSSSGWGGGRWGGGGGGRNRGANDRSSQGGRERSWEDAKARLAARAGRTEAGGGRSTGTSGSSLDGIFANLGQR